jgi:hypothetical protein
MDRSVSLKKGSVVAAYARKHLVESAHVDLLIFRCGESAWRHDLDAPSDELDCGQCHDEKFVPCYNEPEEK